MAAVVSPLVHLLPRGPVPLDPVPSLQPGRRAATVLSLAPAATAPRSTGGVGSSPRHSGSGSWWSAGQASAALGGSSLAPAERRPQVDTVVVEPGDTLWSIAAAARARRGSAGRRRRAGARRAARPRCCRARRSPGSTIDAVQSAPAVRRATAANAPARGTLRWIRALPVLPGERRQGRRLARRRRGRRDPAAARVPRLRAPLHDLRAGRGGRARRAQALGGRRAVRPGQAARRRRAGGHEPARRRRRSTRSSRRSKRSCGSRRRRGRQRAGRPGRARAAAGLDHVAYLRFASVYKGFEDLADFEREVGELQKTTAPKQR